MSKDLSINDIERLMAEADELVRRINADILSELEEEHRLQFEMHAQQLESIKSEVQGGSDKKKNGGQAPARKASMKRFLILLKPCRVSQNHFPDDSQALLNEAGILKWHLMQTKIPSAI